MRTLRPLPKGLLCALIGWCALCTPAALAADTPGQAQIRHLLQTTFDKPDARLRVDPIVIEGRHAVAAWFQGEAAGRALLRQTRTGLWQVMACGGEGMKDPAALSQAGMSTSQARSLARRVTDAEAALSADERAHLDAFGATLHMNGHDRPAPHGGAHTGDAPKAH
jgi:hypothetical protein